MIETVKQLKLYTDTATNKEAPVYIMVDGKKRKVELIDDAEAHFHLHAGEEVE